MDKPIVSSIPLKKFSLWKKFGKKRRLFSFDMEITARCNNNCRHCYINLREDDTKAKENELNRNRINEIADEAISLGALWCLLTGGEPLLREDFFDIFLSLKKKGLIVSINTNATLITEEHVKFLKKYPPRDIEVTVYGVTEKAYEKVTRTPGSFKKFQKGLDLLLKNGIKVRLKAMALRSNLYELSEIARFCEENTKDFFRFDPFINLRHDGNKKRNEEILSERLTPEEIVALERSDPKRFKSLENNCDELIFDGSNSQICEHLFRCGAGNGNCVISYDGFFRLCYSLWHPECVYDLKKGSLAEAYEKFVPDVRNRESKRKKFLKNCRNCRIINLCMWCPANAHLETGELDEFVEYFCEVAQTRAKMLKKGKK